MRADVAVVVVCRDAGRALESAVDSVLAQTRPAAEIVVVDDGSTDAHTRAVVARLTRPRTRVARQAGAGRAAASAHGVSLTAAPYLVLLDAADVLAPAYLETAAARLDADPALGFVSCVGPAGPRTEVTWQAPECTLADQLGRPRVLCTMFRRTVWDAVGGLDPTLPACEEVDARVAALVRGFRGEVLDDPPLIRRRQPPVEPGAFAGAMRAIYLKHAAAVAASARGILLAREAAILAHRAHGEHLARRRHALEAELAGLKTEIAEMTGTLQRRGHEAVEWGDLARVTPMSPFWGMERGRPLDRPLLEAFLGRHREDIHGRVLEVKDAAYTELFGGERVSRADVLDVDPANPRATIVADLARADAIPSESYDCFILTQTLTLVYDVRAALAHAVRVLKPGGVLLCTLGALGRVDPESGADGDFWRFTEASVRRLLAEHLPAESFEVTTVGNVHLCAAFLYGLSLDEIDPALREVADPSFPLVVLARAVKPRAPAAAPARVRPRTARASVLMYHRVDERAGGATIAAADFRAHMEHLRREWEPMSLDALVAGMLDGSLPERAVAVTLDDGYLDALEAASPILAELGVPATFFVTAAALDGPHELWWDALARVLLTRATPAALEVEIDGRSLRLPTATPAERRRAHHTVHERLIRAPLAERAAVLAVLARWCGQPLPPRASHRAMTGEEIAELAARPGHVIGAHGVHHLYLPAQPLHARITEVLESRRRLEAHLRRPVTLFAYPYGAVDADSVEIARAAGFTAAVTVAEATVAPGDLPLAIPRRSVPPGDAQRFAGWLREGIRL
jgi:peptidoglycan/xylan/chitin deacetylase (PgdA/CDA1 family)